MKGRKPETVERQLARGEHPSEPALEVTLGRPAMPLGLSERQKTAWRQIIAQLSATKALAPADAVPIELLASYVGWFREVRAIVNRKGLETADARLVRAATAMGTEARLLAGEFPMSTWSRNRLGMLLTAGAGAGTEQSDMDTAIGPAPRQRFLPKVVGGTDVD